MQPQRDAASYVAVGGYELTDETCRMWSTLQNWQQNTITALLDIVLPNIILLRPS